MTKTLCDPAEFRVNKSSALHRAKIAKTPTNAGVFVMTTMQLLMLHGDRP